MNRKSISEIVNIYNPLQIRDTIICYCSGHEGERTYSTLVCTTHTHTHTHTPQTHTHHTDKRAVLTKQIKHGLTYPKRFMFKFHTFIHVSTDLNLLVF